MAHGISKDEFLETYPGYPMIAEATSEKISESLRRNWENPEYAEKCSSYWRSEAHANKKREDLTKMWETNHENMCKSIQQGIVNSQYAIQRRREVMSKISKKLWVDPDYRKSKSEQGRTQMLLNMSNHKFNFRGRVEYNGEVYRSKLEVSFVKLLESSSIEFEYETYKFEYTDSNGVDRVYIPDFYIPEYKIFVEVKPECFIDNEVVQLKANSVRTAGHRFVFMTEHYIFNNDLSLLV